MQQNALLQQLLADNDLSSAEMEACITAIMTGGFSDIAIAAILALLQKKGVKATELSGAYRAMMTHAIPIELDEHAVDTCGTGGDHAGTFNVSTVAAIIANGAGVSIAKHGNRSVTSRCGSADVLEALGYTIDLSPEATMELFSKTRFAFLFAPLYHPSMKAVAHIRRELGIRTIFNTLGPLANPACVKRQVIGVYDPSIMELYIETLMKTGCRHAMVVHGKTESGAPLDESSVCGITHISELHEGAVSYHSVLPEEFGLSRWKTADLKGGDREDNAMIIRRILDGSASQAQIDASIYAAAMACYVSGKATCIDEGLCLCKESLENGDAAKNFSRILDLNREIADKHRAAVN